MVKERKPINVHEAKTHLSRLLERAHRGEEIILAKAGKPYARLMPLAEQQPRVPGRWKHLGPFPEEFFEPLPEEELAAWEGAYSWDPEREGPETGADSA